MREDSNCNDTNVNLECQWLLANTIKYVPFPQMSTDSGMFENPFREGGKLSRDAEVIIDALKTGKLSVISNQVGWVKVIMGTVIMVQVVMIVDTHVDTQGSEEVDRGKNEDSEDLLGSSNDLNGGSGLLVEPRERKKGEVEKKMMSL